MSDNATLIGRIVDHAPDWKWVQLEEGHGRVSPGDALRLKYHPDADWRRGIAPVFCQDGARIYVAGVLWWKAIPAIADLDYVYRVEPA